MADEVAQQEYRNIKFYVSAFKYEKLLDTLGVP